MGISSLSICSQVTEIISWCLILDVTEWTNKTPSSILKVHEWIHVCKATTTSHRTRFTKINNLDNTAIQNWCLEHLTYRNRFFFRLLQCQRLHKDDKRNRHIGAQFVIGGDVVQGQPHELWIAVSSILADIVRARQWRDLMLAILSGGELDWWIGLFVRRPWDLSWVNFWR